MGIDLTGWALKLFDNVCAAIGGDNAFPPDEPGDARALGREWGALADLLQGGIDNTNKSADKIFAEWTDRAGHDYYALITSYNSGLGGLITSCREMQKFCDQYAHDIEQQRMATRIEMIINAASFALAFTGGGAALAGLFARRLAAGVMKRMLLAAARTAASAEGRTTVRTVAFDIGKEIAIEAGEEAVISGGSQLLTGGVTGRQLVTDTLAGGIGGALGYGPGKLIGGVAKPKGFVGQHVSAAATGAGLNAVTSPVSSVAANDIVNGEFSGLGAYGSSVADNGLDAARMGVVRSNGNVLAGQAGSAMGTPANVGEHTTLMQDLGLTGPDGPPPNNTPASPEATGAEGAGQAAGSTAATETGSAATGSATTGTATTGTATTGTEGTGAENTGAATVSGATGSAAAASAGTGSAAAGSAGTGSAGTASAGTASAATGSAAAASAGTGSAGAGSAGTGSATPGSVGSGSVGSGSAGSPAAATGSAGSGSAAAASGGTGSAGSPAAGAGSAGTGSVGAGSAAASSAGSGSGGSGAVAQGSVSGSATSGKATRSGEQAGAPEVETTQERPVEVSSEAWQGLSQPARDAVNELFGQRTTTQAVKNTVARLAAMNLAGTTTQTIVELAGKLPSTVLTALADIAERAPSALGDALTLAAQNRPSAYQAVREIRDNVSRDPDALAAPEAPATQEVPAQRQEETGAPAATGDAAPSVMVARSVLRAADRYAGMRAVTPPSGDSRAYKVTDPYGNTYAVTAGESEFATTAVEAVMDHRNTIRIVVAANAPVADVPALVAAALAEATAELSGVVHAEHRLVEGSSGDAVLSVRDHGRAARLLAYDQLLQRNPLQLRVRSRLKALIREMGLAPDQDGAAGRLDALPDQRMRTVVEQHTTELDGLPGTVAYLARQLGSAVPAAVLLGAVTVALTPVTAAGATTTAAVLLVRSLVHGLHDRSVAVREGAAADAQYAARSRELKNQATAHLGHVVVRAIAQVTPTGPPSGRSPGVAPVAAQFARIYGMRRYTGALAASTALGVVLLCGAPLSALVATGVFAGLVAPVVRGPSADARKKRHTSALKTQRKDALDTEMNNRVARRADDIAAYVQAFVEQVQAGTAPPPRAQRRPFLNVDAIAGEVAAAVVPPSRKLVENDPDPNGLAELMHLWLENVGFRATNATVAAATSLAFGPRQHDAEQDAAFARKGYDSGREADRDVAMIAAVLADILRTVAPALAADVDMNELAPELESAADDTPLAKDPQRPSGLPSAKWWLLPGVVSGVLMVGAAFGVNQLLGLQYSRGRAFGSAASPITEAIAGRAMTKHEQRKTDEKAERDRASAAAARETQATALGTFAAHVLNGAPPRRVTGDQEVDRILAAQDRAYQALVDAHADVADTLADRVVALHDVAAKAENLARIRKEVAEHGQTRPEVVARNELIAAIQKYNDIVPGVTTLPLARLFDGVHAGNADQHPLPNLPALPENANGQAAWSGNEGWARRIAAAAGVPDGQFRSVAAINDVVARLEQLGPGSRAIVHAQRTNPYSGSPMSGDLVNAVNVDGTVYFVKGGAPADVTGYADGLSMLITEDNGEHARTVADRSAAAAMAAGMTRVKGVYQNHVSGSLLSDPTAPGLPPGLPKETRLSSGLARIASAELGNDMPSIHAFSDQWDFDDEDWPEGTDPAVGLGVARATAGLALAMLETFGGAEPTSMAEFQILSDLLRRQDTPPAELLDAMNALMEALLSAQ